MDPVILPDLDGLVDALRAAGRRVIGPVVSGGAITLDELTHAADLPYGWGVTLDAGRYRLRRRNDNAAFGHAAGPQSWKRFLHPPRERLWSAERTGDGLRVVPDDEPPVPLAFVGVRPCDLRHRHPRHSARHRAAVRGTPGRGVHRHGEPHRAGRHLLLRVGGRGTARRRRAFNVQAPGFREVATPSPGE